MLVKNQLAGKVIPFAPMDKQDRHGTLMAHLHVTQNDGEGRPRVEWLLKSKTAGTTVLLKFQWRQVLEDEVWHVYMDLDQCYISGEFGCSELQAVIYHLVDHWTAIPMNVLCGVIQALKQEAGVSLDHPMEIIPC